MTPAEFEWLCALVKDQSAIVLEPGKEYLAQARLGALAQAEGCENVDAFVGKLRGMRVNGLHRRAVEAMTINETSFFRDWRPFEALRTSIVPELIKARAASRQLNVWSAACSSGQEPCSVAILLREHFPELRGWSVKVLATDFSSEMVERGKSGTYPQLEVNRGLPAPLLLKYFEQHGLEWRVREPVRSMIEFRQANLAADWPSMPQMDIVLLRNVLIYFDLPTKKKILAKVRSVLRPGGVLLLGAAETTFNLDPAWERLAFEGTSAYRPI